MLKDEYRGMKKPEKRNMKAVVAVTMVFPAMKLGTNPAQKMT